MALTKVIGSGVQGISNSSDATAMTIGSDEVVDFASNADFIDGRGIRLGAGNDFQLYHDGTDNHINVTGAQTLNIQTSGNNAIVVDANGIISKPLQPAFLAHPSSTQSNIAVGSDITVLFATEIFDQNADFNTANYTFTAPVTGRYQFNIVYYLENIDTDTGYYYIFFDTSNRNYFNIISPKFTADTDYLSLTLSVLVDMDASDTALCKIRQSHGTSQTDISGNSYFSGYLVA